jgi:hypothetical protein
MCVAYLGTGNNDLKVVSNIMQCLDCSSIYDVPETIIGFWCHQNFNIG